MADKSLNKTELVAKIAASTGQSQATVDAVLDGLFDAIAESVGGGTKVAIPGWLAVERTHRAARTGRNPRPARPSRSPPVTGVKVSAGSKLKAAAK